MTTITEAREAIYQRFVTAWGATSAFTFDGETYSPPANTSWVRLSVRHVDGEQSSLGGVGERKFLRRGLAIIQVFTPLNGGARPADLLAHVARGVFEGIHLTGSGIRFIDSDVREIGPSDSWYQMNVEAVFQYDERK